MIRRVHFLAQWLEVHPLEVWHMPYRRFVELERLMSRGL